MADLSVELGGLHLDYPWMNASGIFSTLPLLEKLCEYKTGAVVTKTITKEERTGHETPVFAESGCYCLNAVGFSCPGMYETGEELCDFYPMERPLIVSVASLTDENEVKEIIEGLEGSFDAIELNVSCPNVYKKIIGQDAKLTEKHTKAARGATKKPLIVKLTPNVTDIGEIARAAEYSGADIISGINTLRGMAIDVYAKRPVLTNRFGGVSGPAIKPVGIGCIYQIYEAVDIPIIGGGGICNAMDVAEYMMAGAGAVFIGTRFYGMPMERIGNFLEKLGNDLCRIMEETGAEKIEDMVGVAHEL